jgi:hypothetical protein
VSASPRRLDLKLCCTLQRSVNSKTLDIWPELPIVIYAMYLQSKQDVTNIIAAFRHHSRVSKIYYCSAGFQDCLLNELAAIDKSFPALIALDLSSFGPNMPVLPDSFLGGSAPRLRSLFLNGIPYPSVGKLLSSTTNLVRLSLRRIPHSGYIAPGTIVPCLSTLVRLESLDLGFRYPRSWGNQENRHPPPLTRVVFPNLTSLDFRGDIEYLEDILSQIETPILNNSQFRLFNQLVFDTPLLGYFIRRMEIFMTSHSARIICSDSSIWIGLSKREGMEGDDRQVLSLGISCRPVDWQLSALAQVLDSFLSSLPTLESLQVAVYGGDWQHEIEFNQWRQLLRPFIAVKEVTLESEQLVRLVAPALQGLARERATEVLPALQNLLLHMEDWQRPGPVKEAVEQFIAARQHCDHPVTIYYWDGESEQYVQ